MKLHIGGTEVRLSFTLLPILCACIVTGETSALLCTCAALLLHECAHAIAGKNLGYRIANLGVYPFGAVMELEPVCAQPGGEWIAAIAGPLGSFLVASVTRLCMLRIAHADWLDRFYATNLAVAALNLLPVYPLDGGRIARQVLLRAVGERTARRLLLIVTCIVSTGALCCCVWLFLRGIYAWSVPLLALALILVAVRTLRQNVMGPVRHVLDRQTALTGGRTMNAAVIAVHPSATVGEAIAAIRPTRYTILYVTDGTTACAVEESRLLQLAAQYGYRTPIKDIILFDQPERTCYNTLFEYRNRIGEDQ